MILTKKNVIKMNFDDYALLSMLHSFSCQFHKFLKVIQASKNATDYIERAMRHDNKNLRLCVG